MKKHINKKEENRNMKDAIERLINSRESSKNENKEEKIKELEKENKKLKKELEKYEKKKGDLLFSEIKSRKSIRKFSGENVKWEYVYNGIISAMNAPAAGGIRNFKTVVVSQKEKKEEIGRLCLQQDWISEAPYIIIFLRDNLRLMNLYPERGERYSIQNTAAAIENFLITVHSYRLGACWVGAYNSEGIKDLLEIPKHFKLDAVVPVGTPLESPKKSLPYGEIREKIFFHKFGNLFKNKKD